MRGRRHFARRRHQGSCGTCCNHRQPGCEMDQFDKAAETEALRTPARSIKEKRLCGSIESLALQPKKHPESKVDWRCHQKYVDDAVNKKSWDRSQSRFLHRRPRRVARGSAHGKAVRLSNRQKCSVNGE